MIDMINSRKNISSKTRSLLGHAFTNCLGEKTCDSIPYVLLPSKIKYTKYLDSMDYSKIYTFIKTGKATTQMDMKRSCLMNQVVHNTHSLRPIINMDSLIRDSFSITSSCNKYECGTISVCARPFHALQKRSPLTTTHVHESV